MKYFIYLVFLIIQSFPLHVIAYDITTLSTNEGQTEPSGGGYETKSEQSLKTGEKNDNENVSFNPIEMIKNIFNSKNNGGDGHEGNLNENLKQKPIEDLIVTSINHRFEGNIHSSLPDGFVAVNNDSEIEKQLKEKDIEFKALFTDCDKVSSMNYPTNEFYLKKSSIQIIKTNNKKPKYSKLIIESIGDSLLFKIQNQITISDIGYNPYYKYKKINNSNCNDRVYISSFINLNEEKIVNEETETINDSFNNFYSGSIIKIMYQNEEISGVDSFDNANLNNFIKLNNEKEKVTLDIQCDKCNPIDYQITINPKSLYTKIEKEEKEIEKEEKEKERLRLIEEKENIKKAEANRLQEEKEKIKREKQEQQKKDEELKVKLRPYKEQCQELGFKEGSKKFKDCVVELID